MGSHILYTYKNDGVYLHPNLPSSTKKSVLVQLHVSIKGPLCAEEPTYTPPQPSIWTQYRPVDITLYDLVYGSPPPPSSDRLAYPYTYRPLHTDIYGISRNRVARMW